MSVRQGQKEENEVPSQGTMGDIAGQKNLDAAEDLRSQAVKWGGWVDDEAHFSGPTPLQALIKKALRRQALWIIWSFCLSADNQTDGRRSR